MRFNTRLDDQFAFDRVAGAYDRGRPRFSVELVRDIARVAGLGPGASVYEVGAGTGQLTRALLDAGLSVTANEPGEELRARLQPLVEAAGGAVRGGIFEDAQAPATPYSAIFAANSFHWVRADVAFEKAAELLAPSGALCLIWNFPIADEPFQEQLNSSAFAGHPDLRCDRATYIPEASLTAGREALVSSGLFGLPWWQLRPTRRSLTADDYVQLTVSYASTAALSPEARATIAAAVRADMTALGTDRIPITDHVYASVAWKLEGTGRSDDTPRA